MKKRPEEKKSLLKRLFGEEDDRQGKRTMIAEQLEPRILYSAAPVDADAAPDAQDAGTIQAAPATPEVAPEDVIDVAIEIASAEQGPVAGVDLNTDVDLLPDEPVDPTEGDEAVDPVNSDAISTLADEAARRWVESGITVEQSEALSQITYQIANLGGNILGATEGSVISLDDDAAGTGWFIDQTPDEDEEFGIIGNGSQRIADVNSAARDRIDLLSILIHEQGHILGLLDLTADQHSNVMFGSFGAGERRAPVEGQADGAIAGSLEGIHYAVVEYGTNGNVAVDEDDVGGTAYSQGATPGVTSFTVAGGTANVADGTYNVGIASNTGTGVGMLVDITFASGVATTADPSYLGSGYDEGDVLTILGSSFTGGADVTDDVTLTITSIPDALVFTPATGGNIDINTSDDSDIVLAGLEFKTDDNDPRSTDGEKIIIADGGQISMQNDASTNHNEIRADIQFGTAATGQQGYIINEDNGDDLIRFYGEVNFQGNEIIISGGNAGFFQLEDQVAFEAGASDEEVRFGESGGTLVSTSGATITLQDDARVRVYGDQSATLAATWNVSGTNSNNRGPQLYVQTTGALGTGDVTLLGEDALLLIADGVDVSNTVTFLDPIASDSFNKYIRWDGVSSQTHTGDITSNENNSSRAFLLVQNESNTVTLSGLLDSGVNNAYLTKSGNGTLVITNVNNNDVGNLERFRVNDGTVIFAEEGTQARENLIVSGDGRLLIGDGVTITATSQVVTNNLAKVIGLQDGASSGTWTGRIDHEVDAAAGRSLDLYAGEGGTLTITAQIRDDNGPEAIADVRKTGAGTVVLTATNNNYGDAGTALGSNTIVTEGTLRVTAGADNLPTNTTLAVNADAFFGGSGDISTFVGSGAGAASFAANSGILVDVDSSGTPLLTIGAAPIDVTGLNLSLNVLTAPVDTNPVTVLNNVQVGTFFANVADSSTVVLDGNQYTVSYAGTDLQLALVGAATVETDVRVDGSGNLIIEDVNGGTSNDNLSLAIVGANYVITESNPANVMSSSNGGTVAASTLQVTVPVASVTGGIQFLSGTGSDTLTINSNLILGGDLDIQTADVIVPNGWTVDTSAVDGNINIGGTLNVQGTGDLAFHMGAGNATIAGSSSNTSDFRLFRHSGSGTVTIDSDVSLDAGVIFDGVSSASTGLFVVNGDMSGAGNNQVRTGVSATLNGDNSGMSGNWTVDSTTGNPVLRVNHENGLGAGNVTLDDSGSRIQFGFDGTLANNITMNNTGNEKTIEVLDNFAVTLTGNVTMNETSSNGTRNRFEVENGATLTITGTLDADSSGFLVQGGDSNSRLIITNGNGNNQVSGRITLNDPGQLVVRDSLALSDNTPALAHADIFLNDTNTILVLGEGIDLPNPIDLTNGGNAKFIRIEDGATSATISGQVEVLETTVGNVRFDVNSGQTLTIAGEVTGAGGAGLRIQGTGGTTVFSGVTNNFAGILDVNAGTVLMNGALTAATVDLAAGTRFGGTGSVSAAVTSAGATIRPGDEAARGTLTADATSTVTLDAASTFEVRINGDADFDALVSLNTAADSVNLADATLNIVMATGYDPVGKTFLIIDGAGAISTKFGNAATEGATVTFGGYDFTVGYATDGGNDVVLTGAAIATAEVNVDLTGGVLTISDIGTDNADEITITDDLTNYVITSRGGAITFSTGDASSGDVTNAPTEIKVAKADVTGNISIGTAIVHLGSDLTTTGDITFTGTTTNLTSAVALNAANVNLSGETDLGINDITINVSGTTGGQTGRIIGAGGLIKQGLGTWNLQANADPGNTFTGGINVQAGTVKVEGGVAGGNRAIDANNVQVTIESGATFDLLSANTIGDLVRFDVLAGGTFNVNAGDLIGNITGTGTVNLNNTLQLRNEVVGASFDGILNGSGSLQIRGQQTSEDPFTLNQADGSTYTGTIVVGSFDGNTGGVGENVNHALHINGQTDAGSVSVRSQREGNGTFEIYSATFGGTGILDAPLNAQILTNLLPGQDAIGTEVVGTLTVNGNVSFGQNSSDGAVNSLVGPDGKILASDGTGATQPHTLIGTNAATRLIFRVDAANDTSDRLVVNGDLDLTRTELILQQLDGSPLTVADDQSYTLVTYTGMLTGSFVENINVPTGFLIDTSIQGQINLVADSPVLLSAVPVDDEIGVEVFTNLTLTFDQVVQAGTGNITLVPTVGGASVAIDVTDGTQVTFSGNVMTVNPTADFLPTTDYHVLIDSTAIANRIDSNTFSGISDPAALNFSTGSDPIAAMTEDTVVLISNGALIIRDINSDSPDTITIRDNAGDPNLIDIVDTGGKTINSSLVGNVGNGTSTVTIDKFLITNGIITDLANLADTVTLEALDVTGGINIDAETATINGVVTATGDVIAQGDFNLASGSLTTGGLEVRGNATINGDVTATGTIIAQNDFSLTSGTIATIGDLEVRGNTFLGGTITAGTIDFQGNVLLTANSSLTTTNGDGSIAGTLDGTSNLTINTGGDDFTVTGAVGATTRIGTLDVNDAGTVAFASSVTASAVDLLEGAITVANGLDVTGSFNIANSAVAGGSGARVGSFTVAAGDVTIGSGGGEDINIGRQNGNNQIEGQGTVNFSNASSVTIDVNRIDIGRSNSTGGAGTFGVLQLSDVGTNSITADAILVGYSLNDGNTNVAIVSQIIFGAMANTVSVDTMEIGQRKAIGTVTIAAGGTLALAGNVNVETNLLIGYNPINTGTNTVGSFDLTGGTVTAALNELIVGQHNEGAGSGDGTLTWDAGTITANSVLLANASAGGAGSTTPANTDGIINMNGTAVLQTASITGGLGTSAFNLNGGTVQNLAGSDLAISGLNLNIGAADGTLDIESGQAANFAAGAGVSLTGAGFLNLDLEVDETGLGNSSQVTFVDAVDLANFKLTLTDTAGTPDDLSYALVTATGGVSNTFNAVTNTATEADEAGYQVQIAANTASLDLLAPDADVQGLTISIEAGDITPEAADDTDFGAAAIADPVVVHTFTIQNNGPIGQDLTGLVVSITGDTSDFSITQPLAATVAGQASTTFTVSFDPASTGAKTATISIASNDPDENPYTFVVTGQATSIVGTPDSEVAVINGVVTFTDTNGGASDDSITITQTGNVIRIEDTADATTIQALAGMTQIDDNTVEVDITAIAGGFNGLTINAEGGTDTVTIGAGLTLTDGDLVINAETINLAGTVATGTGDQTYNGVVNLTGTTTLTGDTVTASQTIDGTQALTVTASTAVVFNGNVGSGVNLVFLDTSGSTATVFDGGASIAVTTTGDQTLGTTQLDVATTLTADSVILQGAVDGLNDLSVSDLIVTATTLANFQGNVGDTNPLTSLTTSGQVSFAGGSIATSLVQTHSGTVSASASTDFAGSELNFQAVNLAAGDYAFQSGTLLNFGGALSGSTADVVINQAAGTILFDDSVNVGSLQIDAGATTEISGNVTLVNAAGTNVIGNQLSFTGSTAGEDFTIDGEAFTLSGDIVTTIPVASGTLTATIDSDLTLGADVSFNTAGTGSGPDTRQHNLLVNGDIGEDIAGRGLTKEGVGIVTLTGDSSYTGTTSVEGGTLLLSGGSLQGTTAISVAFGATFGGTGTATGNTTFASGSVLQLDVNTTGAPLLDLGSGSSIQDAKLVLNVLGSTGVESNVKILTDISGKFAAIDGGETITGSNGRNYQIDYIVNDVNPVNFDVVLTDLGVAPVETTVDVSSGTIVITDIAGASASSNDTLVISQGDGFITISDPQNKIQVNGADGSTIIQVDDFTVQIAETLETAGLTFASEGGIDTLTIASDLTLDGDFVVETADVISANTSVTIDTSAGNGNIVLGGTVAVDNGAGTVEFNAGSGDVTISGNGSNLTDVGRIQHSGTGTLTIDSDITSDGGLIFSGVAQNQRFVVNGEITGSGTIQVINDAFVTVTSDNSDTSGSGGQAAQTGNWTINAAVGESRVTLQHVNGLGTGNTATLTNTNARLQIDIGDATTPAVIANNITMNTGGNQKLLEILDNRVVELTGTISLNENTSSGGRNQLHVQDNATLTISGRLVATASGFQIQAGNANSQVIITNSLGTNAVSGRINVDTGDLVIRESSAIGTSFVQLNNSNTRVVIGENVDLANDITNTTRNGAKVLAVEDGATVAIYSGTLTANDATAGDNRFDVGAGQTLTVTGTVTGTGSGIRTIGEGTVIFDNTATTNFAGTLDIDSGTVILNSALTAATVDVAVAGRLSGTGTTSAAVASVGGTVRPGGESTTGTLTADETSTVTLDAASTFEVRINGDTDFDSLVSLNPTADSVNLAGATLNIVVATGYNPVGTSFTIVDGAGSIATRFGNAVTTGDTVTFGGYDFTVNYDQIDGNDIVLTGAAVAATEIEVNLDAGGNLTVTDQAVGADSADTLTVTGTLTHYIFTSAGGAIDQGTDATDGGVDAVVQNFPGQVQVLKSAVTGNFIIQTSFTGDEATDAGGDVVNLNIDPNAGSNLTGNVEITADTINLGSNVSAGGDITLTGEKILNGDVRLTGVDVFLLDGNTDATTNANAAVGQTNLNGNTLTIDVTGTAGNQTGRITGVGSLIKEGTGSWNMIPYVDQNLANNSTVDGARNDFSGGSVLINKGTLEFTGGGAGRGRGILNTQDVVIANGATLTVNRNDTFGDAMRIEIQAGGTFNSNVNDLIGNVTGAGTLNISAGNLQLRNQVADATFTGTINGGGNLYLYGRFNAERPWILNESTGGTGFTGQIRVGNYGGNTADPSPQHALYINGTTDAASIRVYTYRENDGGLEILDGTLGGVGTADLNGGAGTLTAEILTTIRPGQDGLGTANVGTLTIDGDATFGANSSDGAVNSLISGELITGGPTAFEGVRATTKLEMRVDAANDTSDQLVVNGDLNLNRTDLVLLDISGAALASADDLTYTLISYTGTLSNAGSLNAVNLPAGYELNFDTAGEIRLVTVTPEFLTLNPTDDSTNVAPSSNLVMEFNQNIQAATGNITITDATDNSSTVIIPIGDSQVSITGTTLTIDLGTSLEDFTDYHVQIDAGAITDVDLNPFAGVSDSTTWNFTTGDGTPPTATSIVRLTPADENTNADTLVFRVTFDEDVQNVTQDDFTVSGVTGATVAVAANSATEYDVTVSGGDLANLDAVVGLDFAGGQDIQDLATNNFTGVVTGADETYTVDNTVPVTTSITRNGAVEDTASDSLTFRVSFSEDVQNVGANDFTITGTTATISSVAPAGGNNAYDVTLTGGDLASLNGTVGLDIAGSPTVTDAAGNALATGDPATDETYALDNTVPTTTSIARQTPSGETTNADSLTFRVTFSEDVLNVGVNDFAVTGTTGTISAVAAAGGSNVYDVTVTGGDLDSLNGTVGLDIAGTPTVTDAAGNALATGDPATDETYALDNTVPTTTSIARQTPSSEHTNVDSLTFRVTFSEDVQDVGANDFTITGTTATISSVAPAGGNNAYDVTLTGGDLAGLNGTVGFDIAGAPTVTDLAGNALATGDPATDETYVLDNVAPVAASFTRLTPANEQTSADTLTFEVTFTDSGSTVDPATVDGTDFAVSGSTATVTGVVNTGTNLFQITISGGDLPSTNGAVGLDFAPGANILDRAGNVLTVAEPSTDETYTLDNVVTAPAFSPADGASGVTVDSNLVLTFAEDVAVGTGNITIKNLTDATQTVIAVGDSSQVSILGGVVTINPTAALDSGKSYAVQIDATAIEDLFGNAFAGIADDTTWNFGTSIVSLAPEGADKTLTVDQDSTLTITTSDFGFSDSNTPPDNFVGVVISELPTVGTLNLDGVAVTAGDFITIADLNANKLTFDPVAGQNGASYADFSFQVIDDGLGITPTVNVVAITDIATVEGYNIAGNNVGSQTLTSFTDAGGTYTDLKFATSLSQAAPGGGSILHGDGTAAPASGTDAMTDSRIDTGVLNPNSATVYQFSDSLTATDKIFVFVNNTSDLPLTIQAHDGSGLIGSQVSIAGTVGALGTFNFERNDGPLPNLNNRTFGGFAIEVADLGVTDPSTIQGIRFTGNSQQDFNLIGFASVPADANTDQTPNTITVDVTPALEVSITANLASAGEPSTNGQFTVSLNRTSAQDTVVSYVVTGDATAGSDYTPLTGEVTILANQISAVIDVTVLTDALIEPSETVIVTLTGVTGAPSANTSSFQDGVSPTVGFNADIAYLRENNGDADTTLGVTDSGRLLLGGQGATGEFNVIVEYDLSSFSGLSDGAELSFELQSTFAGNLDLNVYQYAFDFDAANATWNNPSGLGTDPTAGGTKGALLTTLNVTSATAGSLITFPSSSALNGAVNAALAAGDNTLRLLVAGNGTTTEFLRLHGNGNATAANRPSLVITASTATIGASASATVNIADGPITTDVIYVDNSWTDQAAFDLDTDLDDGSSVVENGEFLTNAFNNLADALAAVDVGGTIVINSGSGSYTGLALNKNVTLQISGDSGSEQAVTITELSSIAGTIIDIQGGSSLTVDHTATQNLIGTITGSGSFAKAGTGTLTLSGTNDYTGSTTVSAGSLIVGSDTALGTNAAGTTVADGATLILADGITVADEAVTINGAGESFGGALRVEAGGDAQWGGDVLLGATPRIGADTGGNLTISGVIQNSGSSNLVISAAPGGSGTVTLSGANTYTGSTTITRGTLALGATNTLPVTTTLTIDNSIANDNAILDLNGFDQTVASLVRGNTGGTGTSELINSSATSNTLTVTGNLAYTGTLQLGVDGANDLADLVTVGGNLDITNTTLDLSAVDSTPDDASYTLLSYTGTLTGAAFSAEVGVPAGYFVDIDTTAKTINLVKNPAAVTTIEGAGAPTTHGVGDTVTVTVNFDEAVTLSAAGEARVSLDIGGTTVDAIHTGSTSGTALTFAYVVQAGQDDADGVDVIANTLALTNGATLQNGLSSDATLTHAAQNLANDLVDTTAPAAPAAPDLNAGSDTGSSSSDDVTSDTTPTIDGVAEPGSTVTLTSSIDGVVGTATADPTTGVYSISANLTTDGDHDLTVTATDEAGNTSANSATLTVTLDTAAPSDPTGLDLVAASDSGVNNDDLTNLTSVVITGAAGSAEPNAEVILSSNLDGVVGTAQAAADGSWSITAPLTENTHSLTATATDLAGNRSLASAPLTLEVDTTPPAAPGAPTLNGAANDTGASPTDGVTNNPNPTISGTGAEPGSTVELFHGTTSLGTAIADGSGNYSITTGGLADGTFDLTTVVTDPAGNVSATSAPTTVTVDTVSSPVSTVTGNLTGDILTVTVDVPEASTLDVGGASVVVDLGGGFNALATSPTAQGPGTSFIFTVTLTPAELAAAQANGVDLTSINGTAFADIAGNPVDLASVVPGTEIVAALPTTGGGGGTPPPATNTGSGTTTPQPPAATPNTFTDQQTEQEGDEEGVTIESDRLQGLVNSFQTGAGSFGLGQGVFVGFQGAELDVSQASSISRALEAYENLLDDHNPVVGALRQMNDQSLLQLTPIFAGIGAPGSYVQVEITAADGTRITQSSYVDGGGNWLVSFDSAGEPAEIRIVYSPAIGGAVDHSQSSSWSMNFSGASSLLAAAGLGRGDIAGAMFELIPESDSGLEDALGD